MQDIVFQLHRFITALDKYHRDCNQTMIEADIFPIEVELNFPTTSQQQYDDDEEEEEEEQVTVDDQPEQKKEDINLLDIEE